MDCDPYSYQVQIGKNKYETRYDYNSFVGNYIGDFAVPDKCLFLDENKFWYSDGTNKMKGYRAYFNFYDVLPAAEEAATRILIHNDSGTTTIEDSQRLADDGGYYDLRGRRVMRPAKGLYVRDGKKTIVR